MATSDVETVKTIVLRLSEREAKYLLSLTQNCIMHNGGMRPEDQTEPADEARMREAIFDAIHFQGIRT